MIKMTLIGSIILAFSAMNVSANTVNYPDSIKHLPNQGGWNNQDTLDVIHGPDVSSMDVTTDDNGFLQEVKIYISSLLVTSYVRGFYDTLMINNDSNDISFATDWDYWVKRDLGLGVEEYSVANGVYRSTNSDYEADYYKNAYRADHANGFDGGTAAASFLTGVTGDASADNSIITYTFDPANAIHIGKSYAIAWMPSCANDVVVGSTPIPPAVLLFGSALLGVFGFKRFNNETV